MTLSSVDIKYNIKMFKSYRDRSMNRFVVSITTTRWPQAPSQFSLAFCIPSRYIEWIYTNNTFYIKMDINISDSIEFFIVDSSQISLFIQ